MTRKSQHIRDVTKILGRVSAKDLHDTVHLFLKSTKFDIDARRGLIGELKTKARAPVEMQIYPDMNITEYQLGRMVHDGWADYVAAVIETAYMTLGEISIIIETLDVFLKEIGEDHLTGMNRNNASKGVIGAILMLGGYTFKTQRTEYTTRRILTAIEGTEFMDLEDRQKLALDRCKRLGVI